MGDPKPGLKQWLNDPYMDADLRNFMLDSLATIAELKADGKRAYAIYMEAGVLMRATIDEQQATIADLRAALEFYADKHNSKAGPWRVNSDDFGDVAKAALKEKNDES